MLWLAAAEGAATSTIGARLGSCNTKLPCIRARLTGLSSPWSLGESWECLQLCLYFNAQAYLPRDRERSSEGANDLMTILYLCEYPSGPSHNVHPPSRPPLGFIGGSEAARQPLIHSPKP